MPSIRESLDLDGHVRLKRWLARAAAERVTGTLRLSGRPGGVLRFSGGLVVAVESSGAPGVQALLIRTGRVDDEDWARDGGADQETSSARIGAAHRQVLQLMANQDALFAVLAGSIDSCVLESKPPAPQAGQGQDAAALLAAACWKLDALTQLPRAILPYRERLVAVRAEDGADAAGSGISRLPPSELRKVILGHADGRRTARDIAFVSGRSLYPVTVEMSRMLAEGLLHEPPPRTEPVDRTPVRVMPRQPPPPSRAPDAQALEARAELPRRRPPADGPAEDAVSQKTAACWRDFLHFGRMGESRN